MSQDQASCRYVAGPEQFQHVYQMANYFNLATYVWCNQISFIMSWRVHVLNIFLLNIQQEHRGSIGLNTFLLKIVTSSVRGTRLTKA